MTQTVVRPAAAPARRPVPAPFAECDPFAPEHRRDPYPVYRMLRERAPVHLLARRRLWLVCRHADVSSALKSPEVFSSAIYAGTDPTLFGADPPAHTRVRRLVSQAFSPRRVAALEQHVRALGEQLLAEATRRPEIDVIGDVASPLSLAVIRELLGIAPKLAEPFRRWSDAIVIAMSGAPSPAQRFRIDRDIADFTSFVHEHIARCAREPGTDMLSELVGGDGAGSLSTAEAASLVRLLIIAGSETTTNLVGNAVLALLRHPEQMTRVREDPTLSGPFVDEVLRYDPPVQFVIRLTTTATAIDGTEIPSRAPVALCLAAANRDPGVFSEPDSFTIGRDTRDHLGFAAGPHYCLGASLGRLEARVVFEQLFARLGTLRPSRSIDGIEWLDSVQVRGPRALYLAT
jgi:cytochrome P450